MQWINNHLFNQDRIEVVSEKLIEKNKFLADLNQSAK